MPCLTGWHSSPPLQRSLILSLYCPWRSWRWSLDTSSSVTWCKSSTLDILLLYLIGHSRTLLRVSKQWYQFMTSMARLWNRIDLSRAHKAVSVTAIRACIRRSKGGITHATLNHVASVNSDILKHVTSRSKGLRYLEIGDCFSGPSIVKVAPLAQNLSTLILSADLHIALHEVTQILSLFASLERAEFRSIICTGPVAQWQIRSKIRVLVLKAAKGMGSPVASLNLVCSCRSICSVRITDLLVHIECLV